MRRALLRRVGSEVPRLLLETLETGEVPEPHAFESLRASAAIRAAAGDAVSAVVADAVGAVERGWDVVRTLAAANDAADLAADSALALAYAAAVAAHRSRKLSVSISAANRFASIPIG
jgi:hypothetical protein